MEDVARIVLAVESEHLAQDVIDFLDRADRTRVVDSVRAADALAMVVGRERPDAVVGSPGIVRSAGELNGSVFLAVSTEESVRTLREAVDSGARGFFLWPADRIALGTAAARTAHPQNGRGRRAKVIAVVGSRGGAGATFVSTHLAAALAQRGKETVVIDAGVGDLGWALGTSPDVEVRTLADLSPVQDEISEDHIRNALWSHATGVRALLAAQTGARIDDTRLFGVVEAAAPLCDVLVVHAPPVGPIADSTVEVDLLLVVVSLDVLAFRAAKRAIDSLEDGVRWDIVVNRAARGRIVAADVERVFGRPAVAVLPDERRVAEAQDRGDLVPPRTRVGRAVGRLAERVLREVSA